MRNIENRIKLTDNYIGKVRYGQEILNGTHSQCKVIPELYVSQKQLKRIKERINAVIRIFCQLFEEGQRRDHVLAESLL